MLFVERWIVSCNIPKKIRLGRLVKKNLGGGGGGGGGGGLFFFQKCVFYACFMLIWSWEGEEVF